MATERLVCLIDEAACGRQATDDSVCSKCGLDTRVMYPSRTDLELALQNATVKYWRTHAEQLEQRLKDFAEREEIERRKGEESRQQADRDRRDRELSKAEEARRLSDMEQEVREQRKAVDSESARQRELQEAARRNAEYGRQVPPDIDRRVKKIIAEQLCVKHSELTSAMSFTGDLAADSLDLIELVMAAEDEFRIEISDDDAEKLDTVQKAIEYISRCVSR